jgi:hypothetical protein
MTVVSHEREPQQLGFAGRYEKLVGELVKRVRNEPALHGADQMRDLGRAVVEADMLHFHVSRRHSERIDGVTHGPEGSIDKLLMTWTEQAVGNASLSVGGNQPPR